MSRLWSPQLTNLEDELVLLGSPCPYLKWFSYHWSRHHAIVQYPLGEFLCHLLCLSQCYLGSSSSCKMQMAIVMLPSRIFSLSSPISHWYGHSGSCLLHPSWQYCLCTMLSTARSCRFHLCLLLDIMFDWIICHSHRWKRSPLLRK